MHCHQISLCITRSQLNSCHWHELELVLRTAPSPLNQPLPLHPALNLTGSISMLDPQSRFEIFSAERLSSRSVFASPNAFADRRRGAQPVTSSQPRHFVADHMRCPRIAASLKIACSV
jgi:hypothetical protein